MTDSARDIAYEAIFEILERGRLSHLVLAGTLSKYAWLEHRDRALVNRLTLGTVENVYFEDWVLSQFSKVPVGKMKPQIRTILRMSVYQIFRMDRVPDAAAINEAVRMAKDRGFRGLSGFVNGVLRNISRKKDTLTPEGAARYSMAPWMYDLFVRELGKDRAERMMAAFFMTEPLTVRVNRARASAEKVIESLRAQGITARPLTESGDVLALTGIDMPGEVGVIRDGLVSVQDLSSSLAGDAAGIREGDFVVDVCGAPGGKALHAADLLYGTGEVLVRDLSETRVSLIRENIEASGFTNIRAEVHDATVYSPELEGKADVVIADLPCSGLGVIGRKPDIRINASPEKIAELAKLQRKILDTVWRYVKPGGVLVYSTCTLTRAENGDNADWFLKNHPFSPVDIRGRLGKEYSDPSMKEGRLLLIPGEHPSDGFFICVMRRNE